MKFQQGLYVCLLQKTVFYISNLGARNIVQKLETGCYISNECVLRSLFFDGEGHLIILAGSRRHKYKQEADGQQGHYGYVQIHGNCLLFYWLVYNIISLQLKLYCHLAHNLKIHYNKFVIS